MRRRRSHSGFTLIELLVVILILGILAGIVVFAVRGADDKGATAAALAEERMIRTAQEAFCAKEGRYGEQQELIDLKYLSDAPGYWSIDAIPPHETFSGPRPCNQWAYTLDDPSPPTTPSTPPSTDCTGNPASWSGPLWCKTGAPSGSLDDDAWAANRLLQLLDGRVLAVTLDKTSGADVWRTELYSPSTGSWTQEAGPPGAVHHRSDMILLANGKVLLAAVVGTDWEESFFLYTPAASGPGSWTPILSGMDATTADVRMIQLANGKVLLVTPKSTNANAPPTVRLFNPDGSDPVFETISPEKDLDNVSALAALPSPDNRILVVSVKRERNILGQNVFVPVSELFDPQSKLFSDTEAMPKYNWWADASALLLDTGKILISGRGQFPIREAEVFDPESSTWNPVPECGEFTPPLQSDHCFLLAKLDDGKVLAKASRGQQGRDTSGNTGKLHLFNPVTNTWAPVEPGPAPLSVRSAVLLKTPGCAPHCGRVLVAGAAGVKAELFTP